MPDDGLKDSEWGVTVCGIHGRNDHRRIRDLCGITAVATEYSEDFGTHADLA